jgi:hypothetical protein
MAGKTYAVGLYLAVYSLYRYIARWQPKLEASLDASTYACVLALLAAVNECLPLIKPPSPTD